MKTALFAAAAMIAMPAFAQTTPSTAPMQDQSSMAAPQQTAPTTPPTTQDPSTMATPAATPDAQNATTAPMSTAGTMPDPNAPAAGAPVTTNAAGQMSMVGDNLPWCRPGQYNACREHENAKGQGIGQTGKTMRKHKAKKSSM